jgi:hypothetical protein
MKNAPHNQLPLPVGLVQVYVDWLSRVFEAPYRARG